MASTLRDVTTGVRVPAPAPGEARWLRDAELCDGLWLDFRAKADSAGQGPAPALPRSGRRRESERPAKGASSVSTSIAMRTGGYVRHVHAGHLAQGASYCEPMRRKMWRHRITGAGQVSIPAEVRHRWGTSTVAIEDEGDRIVLRPVPDDPIAALRGSLADLRTDITAAEAVRAARDEDIEAEEEKWKRLGWA